MGYSLYYHSKRKSKDTLPEYPLAVESAISWLNSNGVYTGAWDKPGKIAYHLGLVPKTRSPSSAKKSIVAWYKDSIAATEERHETTSSDKFYRSQSWRIARFEALKKSNGRCALCGSPPGEYSLHVDHIKPRSLYPSEALNPKNLQVLCRDCNLGKSNRDATDWRSKPDDSIFDVLFPDERQDVEIGKPHRTTSEFLALSAEDRIDP